MHPLLTNALRSQCHHPEPDINHLLEQARKILEDAAASTEQFAAELATGKTLAQCLGIADLALESSFQAACRLVKEKMFQEALILASFVFVAGPREARFVFKLASCLQHLGDVENAADFYKLALQIDNLHIGAAYRLGECLEMLGDDDQATRLFEWTIELARGNFAHQKAQAAAESRLRRRPLLP